MFHTSKDSFFLLSLKHTYSEFSIISVPPSHKGHAGGTQLVHKAATELHREGTRLLPLTTDLLLLITVTEPLTAFLLQVHLSLDAKELCSLWAEGSQTHSLLHGPLALGTFQVPLISECFHHFLSHKAVHCCLFPPQGKGEASYSGLQNNGSSWKERFESNTQVASDIFPSPVVLLFLEFSEKLQNLLWHYFIKPVSGPNGLFYYVPNIVCID